MKAWMDSLGHKIAILSKITHILESAIIKDIGFRRSLITQIKNVLLQLMLMEEYLVMGHQ